MPVFMRVCANMFAAGRVRFQARLGLRPVGSLHCAARHMHALGCAAQPQRASPDRLAAAPTRLCAAPPPHARPPVPARPCAALQFELALGSLFLEGILRIDMDRILGGISFREVRRGQGAPIAARCAHAAGPHPLRPRT